MPKARTRFVCQQCGYSSPRWSGRCPECDSWNTLVETVEERGTSGLPRTSPTSTPLPLGDIRADTFTRIPVAMDEFSRALGGGIVPGSVVLIGGDPGIGKSTILLQVSAMLAGAGRPTLYASGEESSQQIKLRAERLGISEKRLYVLSETNLGAVIEHIEQLKPELVVVDSIQSVYLDELESSAGSITQVRECAAALIRLAKSQGLPIFLVGHVTKQGTIAGPRVLEHMVDTVLYLEGERFHSYRILRSVKNRFGSTNEVGVFEMQEKGMVEITNPSEAFLAERLAAAAGSVVAVTMEGTRPILVEIQALTTNSHASLARRTANGIDFNRLLLLIAVLSKRVRLRLSSQDVFVNVVGGLRINEPAADLAVATAIVSSLRNIPVPEDLVLLGEVGLSGELRSVRHLDRRLTEATKLGFKRCVVPRSSRSVRLPSGGSKILPARSLGEALDLALGPTRAPSDE